jgi:hypothetical protein
LKDLTFIEDGNPDKEEEWYNFAKFRMISDILSEVIRWQKIPYSLTPIQEIQVHTREREREGEWNPLEM